MRRTFNYTGRRKIAHRRIEIRIHDDEKKQRYFRAELDFQGLPFPEDARVFIEAYYDVTFMRFDFGERGRLQTPASTYLTDLGFTDRLHFRVKVIDEQVGHGRILGIADQVRPHFPDTQPVHRESLLPVNAVSGMGQEIWRLSFDGLNGPVLEVNRDIPEITSLIAHDRRVNLLVYPAVLRQVLITALVIEGLDPEDSGGSWADRWLSFVRSFYPDPPPPYDRDSDNWDECEAWIESAVSLFATRINARAGFIEAMEEDRG